MLWFTETENGLVVTEKMVDQTSLCHYDFSTFDDVELVAKKFSTESDTYLAVDRGDHCYPRYDVIRAPKVGEPISRAINGDYYPDGFIARITDGFKTVISTQGTRYRRTKTGGWVANRYFAMVYGHRSELNPHF